MSKFRAYLERQQPLEVTEYLSVPVERSTLFVTIPCYDEPELLSALQSLADCEPPVSRMTVIVVVNSSDQTPSDVMSRNRQTILSVLDWWKNLPNPFFQLRLLHVPSLPFKWAGVGWARKIAMDDFC